MKIRKNGGSFTIVQCVSFFLPRLQKMMTPIFVGNQVFDYFFANCKVDWADCPLLGPTFLRFCQKKKKKMGQKFLKDLSQEMSELIYQSSLLNLCAAYTLRALGCCAGSMAAAEKQSDIQLSYTSKSMNWSLICLPMINEAQRSTRLYLL